MNPSPEQMTILHDLFNQINERLAIIGETPDAYFLCQCVDILKQHGQTIDTQATEIAELKAKLAEVESKLLAQPDEPVGIVVYKPKMLRVGALNTAGMALPDGTRLYTHPAPFTPKDIVEKCAQVCESRFRSLMADNNITAGNEAHKCASAVRHHGLTYPFTPITADMVKDEVINMLVSAEPNMRKALFVVAVNSLNMGAKK